MIFCPRCYSINIEIKEETSTNNYNICECETCCYKSEYPEFDHPEGFIHPSKPGGEIEWQL